MTLSSRSFIKFSPAADRRRLAALMFTDIVGYSSIFHRDETLAMKLLGEKSQILRDIFPAYGGREIKTLGDGFLIEFASVQEAVKCAYDIQSHLFQRNLGESSNSRFEIRIGVHLCDFIATDEDVFGNDVNISSRLEKIASPGGVCVSQQVVDQVRDKLELTFTQLKAQKLKNIRRKVVCYEVDLPWAAGKKPKHVLDQFSRFYRQMTVRHFLRDVSRFLVLPLVLWACVQFLSPQHNLSVEQFFSLIGKWFKSFIGLNPILGIMAFFSWAGHAKDRRLLYMFITFAFASLNLVPLFPEFFGTLDGHALEILSIFSTGLISVTFVAVTSVELKLGKLESASSLWLALLLFFGLQPTPLLSNHFFRNVTAVISVAAVAYLVVQAWSMTKQKSPLAGLMVRRSMYAAMATVSFFLLNFEGGFVRDSISNEVSIFLFPVIYPLMVILFTIKSHLESTRLLARISAAARGIDQISAAVSSGEAYEEKLSIIQARLCEVLGAERSTIYLTDIDSGEQQLKAQAIYGPTEKLNQVALQVSPTEGLIGRVWKSRSPLMVNDLKSDSRLEKHEKSHYRNRNEYRTSSCLLCPVVHGNEIVGVITLSDKRSNESFDMQDLKMVQNVAKDIALLSVHQRFQGMIDHFIAEKLNEFKKTS